MNELVLINKQSILVNILVKHCYSNRLISSCRLCVLLHSPDVLLHFAMNREGVEPAAGNDGWNKGM